MSKSNAAKRYRVWMVCLLRKPNELAYFFPYFKEEEARSADAMAKNLGYDTVIYKDTVSLSPAGITSWFQRTSAMFHDKEGWDKE